MDNLKTLNETVKVSDEVIKLMDDLGKRIGIAIDWTQKNVMPQVQDFFRRLTLYEIGTSIAWIVFAIAIIVTCIVLMKKMHTNDCGDYEAAAFFYVLFIIFIIISCVVIGYQILDIIKALTIPETIWIDYIKDFSSSIKN